MNKAQGASQINLTEFGKGVYLIRIDSLNHVEFVSVIGQ
jgi:hypothetical protein